MNRWFGGLVVFYILLAGALLLFSYTQVDLSLTLSHASIVQTIQQAFQHIGFYERPLATEIYGTILFFLSVGYVLTFFLSLRQLITRRQFWKLVGVLSIILLFSYPAALSYDVFNYIFTAKTVLVYRLNPYSVIPLQFQGIDPMLSFMRWTHLASAYTPVWIGLTLPFFLLSFGSLLLGLWTMKALTVMFYLFSVFLIGKIMDTFDKKQTIPAMALFAFNPLVIVEVLLGAHNDGVMMAFALLAFYLSLRKKRLWSFFSLSLSVATKLITGALLPLSVFGWNRWSALALMSLALGAVLLRREFLPWYFLWVLPFASLFPKNRYIFLVVLGISCGLLLRYAPVLYFGHSNDPVPQIQMYGTIIPVGFSVFLMVFTYFLQKQKK